MAAKQKQNPKEVKKTKQKVMGKSRSFAAEQQSDSMNTRISEENSNKVASELNQVLAAESEKNKHISGILT